MHGKDRLDKLTLTWLILPAAMGALGGCAAPDPRQGPDPSAQKPEHEESAAPPAPAKAAAVTRVDEDWEAAGLARDRGISLAEAQRRLRWQVLAPDLSTKLAADLGDQFGGLWIDVQDGDRIKVGVTGKESPGVPRSPVAVMTARIERAVAAAGLTEAVDIVEVRHSMPTLQRTMAWVAAQMRKVNRGTPATVVAGVRTNINAVQLDLPPASEVSEAQRELAATAKERFGDQISLGTSPGHLVSHACTYPNCDAPLRGGVQIHNTGSCTGGFIAKSNVNSQLYQFTAGHCGWADPGSWTAFHADGSAQLIGPMHHWLWYSGGDMAIVEISDMVSWNPQPWVYVTYSADTTLNTQYTISSTNWSVVGQRICVTGAFLGYSDCGTVTDLGVTITETVEGTAVDVDNVGRANYCAVSGDSGAPLYASHVAYGLHIAAFPCDSFFQGIRQAESALNVKVVLSP